MARDYSQDKHTEERAARNAMIYATACADPSLSLPELADKFGMSLSQVAHILKRSGMVEKPRPVRFPNRERDAAICAAACTDPAPSLQQIGDRFGLSFHGVYHVLLKNGVTKPRPAHNPVNYERNSVICAMASDDMPQSQIGKQIGLSKSGVGSALQTSGDLDYSALVQTRKQESHAATTANKELNVLQVTIRRKIRSTRTRVVIKGRTPEAVAYKNMFRNHGGSICPQWLGPDGFQNFYRDLGPRPAGIDANGRSLYTLCCLDDGLVYSPETVVWELRKEGI